ncbi:hypothetical protein [Aliivibrio sp. S10_S31]|uniref:hypothetical protein n=1 Tax=Aliivibrio sp. S10_S31 TaxID=2720224 RepID=UPI001681A5E1|nr:hypothetical protein [Aliivibrio sp. S10_S31]MBD1571542.1 hypothetical protein [Aliivibrio sp. S10_S31]
MARKFNDHFIVYSIFWMILSGLAYLLTLFFRAKNLNDISNTIGIVATYLLLPITFILFLLVMILLIIEGTFDIGLLTIVSAFPMIYVGILFWKSLQNKFTLLEM